ncbi:MAG: ABC transporter substrate-binding protein [Anaeromyxobacter sp.]
MTALRRLGGLAAAALIALPAVPARAGVRPAHGGPFRLALPALPSTLDPALAVEPQDVAAARATSAPLLELDAAGRLAPGLLEEVPVPDPTGRTYHLRLRPDLRTFDDRPVGAPELAAAFGRLAAPATRSPHAWAVLPILGAEAALAGRAPALAGVSIVSEREVLVTLERPLPGFPRVLAALPLALPGLGPFQPPRAPAAGDALTLPANPRCPRGPPYAAALVLVAARDARAAARLLERGEADLVLRPEPPAGRAGPRSPPSPRSWPRSSRRASAPRPRRSGPRSRGSTGPTSPAAARAAPPSRSRPSCRARSSRRATPRSRRPRRRRAGCRAR